MTREEFSNQFDTMLNSYASQALFGEQAAKSDVVLDEYEKSVILTSAQDIVVKSFFDRKKNSTNDGFDDNTERQIDFSSLIVSKELQKSSNQATKFDDRGIIFDMPLRAGSNSTDVLFILNEKLVTKVGNLTKTYVVVPLNYKEYDREMSKPYAQPLKKQAWRLFQNPTTGFDFKSELIPRWNLEASESSLEYKIRYIRRPTPIVLIDLPDGLSIDGESVAKDCELNPILHPEILQKAVELAAASRGISRPVQKAEQ